MNAAAGKGQQNSGDEALEAKRKLLHPKYPKPPYPITF